MNNANANGMKVWQVDDQNWIAALTSEQAIAEHKNMTSLDDDELEEDYPIEMDSAWLDRAVQEFDEDEQPIPGRYTTARRYLDEIMTTEAVWFWGYE